MGFGKTENSRGDKSNTSIGAGCRALWPGKARQCWRFSLVVHPRFFSAQPLPHPSAGAIDFDVDDDIARHLHVLRIGVDERVTLFDGSGGEWSAVVSRIDKRHARVRLLAFDAIERESPLTITLVQALAMSDKMDFIVQKAVELGVSAIQPITSERATLKLMGERAQKRVMHWQAVTRAACEQCGRNRIPVVAEIVAFESWVDKTVDGVRLVLHPQGRSSLVSSVNATAPLSIMIGPEGGFSDHEIALTARHGIKAVTMGPRVLRTETAGLAALAALNAVTGDFQDDWR